MNLPKKIRLQSFRYFAFQAHYALEYSHISKTQKQAQDEPPLLSDRRTCLAERDLKNSWGAYCATQGLPKRAAMKLKVHSWTVFFNKG